MTADCLGYHLSGKLHFKKHFLWTPLKVEINDNRFADQKKNYSLWHALCQWTVVRSCKSLMCTRHTLTWNAQEIVTCWVAERISLQLLREAQKCLAPQPQVPHGFRSPEWPRLTVMAAIFQHFKAWTEIYCPLRSLLSLASPKIEETSEFGYFCCWLSNLTLTASVHKLHPEALTQSHGKFAGRKDE